MHRGRDPCDKYQFRDRGRVEHNLDSLMSSVDTDGSFAAAWQEAAVLYRLAQKTGDFASIRLDILPSPDTDPSMRRYRGIVLSFFDRFMRLGHIPPRPCLKPLKQQTRRRCISDEKRAQIVAALQSGWNGKQIQQSLHTGPNTVRKVRLQLAQEQQAHAR